MSTEAIVIDLRWRASFAGLLRNLEVQRSCSEYAGPASPTALAILRLLQADAELTLSVIADFTQEHCAPANGWPTTGANRFSYAATLQRVLPVVAALKSDKPGYNLARIS